MLLSPVNVSCGRPGAVLDALVAAAGPDLLDLHADVHHNRSVLTLVGTEAPRRVARVAVARIDLRRHLGAHPRLGAIDVVPFVPAPGPFPDPFWSPEPRDARGERDQNGEAADLSEARAARDAFIEWATTELGVPALSYGDDGESLPDLRRRARRTVTPHPTAGAICVGARQPLVAYNVWLRDPDLKTAKKVAADVRGEGIRALGLRVGERVQVSMNLIDPTSVGPAAAYDAVSSRADVSQAELVGLIPSEVLRGVPQRRWEQLDVSEEQTIEHRLARRTRPEATGGP